MFAVFSQLTIQPASWNKSALPYISLISYFGAADLRPMP